MHSSDWLTSLVLIAPLWVMTTLLLIVARRLGADAERVSALVGIALIAVPVTAVFYIFLTGWRPTWYDLILYLVSNLASELVADRFDPQREQPSVADLAQFGRDINRRMRTQLSTLGLMLATIAVGLSTIRPIFGVILVAITSVWTVVWIPAAMRRTEGAADITVRCTPEQAFDFVGDARNQASFLAEVESIEPLTLGSPRRGTRRRIHLRDGTHAIEEILEYDRPRRLIVGLPATLQANRGIWSFEPVPGGTRIRYAYQYELQFVEALAGGRLVVGLDLAHQSAWRRAFLARLKVQLETPRPASDREWTA